MVHIHIWAEKVVFLFLSLSLSTAMMCVRGVSENMIFFLLSGACVVIYGEMNAR
jgi:hypothetical protein